MIDFIEKSKCTGCKLCADICPVSAISFPEDEYGFWYPKVDYEKCINCSLCKDKCPGINTYSSSKYHEPQVYAAWLKDKEMRLYSTSGGVYYALAKKVLDDGGIVAACRFTDDWKGAEHIVVKDESELLPTVRSKYFQSDTGGIYNSVMEYLESGKKVLFCGTPCQCAAMQVAAGDNCNNLITMDFICRGNNSPKAYNAFIGELEKRYNSEIESVQFKNKRNGWKSLGVLIKFKNGEEYYDTRYKSYWTLGYIKDNLYMRPVCHECQYRTLPRISDFTVGDFWGIKDISEEDSFNGVSVVFTNSDFAAEFLNELKSTLEFKQRDLSEAINGNVCILKSPAKGEHREEFFELLKTKCFSDAVAECCGKLE